MIEKTTMACPACRETDHDTKGEHLAVFPNKKFHCIRFGKDKEHNRRIIELMPELGAPASHLREQETDRSRGKRIVAEYTYYTETGQPVYQVVRLDPKGFRQQRLVDGYPVRNMEGVVRVPYNLPDVMAASTVIIVEGEKDADNLNALGFVATCNAGGAGKWENRWAPCFAGRDVILCGDNDEPGRKHMAQVATALTPVAKSVMQVTVPEPSKDISDYIEGTSDSEAIAAIEHLLSTAVPVRAQPEEEILAPPINPPKGYPSNDYGNAQRFVDYAGDKVRYIPEREKWIVWNGQHWRVDIDGAIYRLAAQHSTELLRTSADMVDSSLMAKTAKLALSLGKRSIIENMLALARYNEAVILPAAKLDSDPWLLGVPNGVVDLKTGAFRAGEQADLITNTVGCNYVPHAGCPIFDSFLDRIMGGDAEMISYLWRIFGYCLTGLATEQCLFFFYGPGRNGKSTLIEVLAALLHDYGRATAVELITDSHNGREPSQLIAALHGRRLVWLHEVEDNHRVAQARLKTLTGGGDRLCGRRLYEEEFEFDCTAKLLIHGNSRPEIRGTDLGIWRRFRLIPFAITIPPEEVDPDLSKRLIEELPGILNRAIAACLEWQRKGLMTPKTVIAATEAYREDEDLLGEFLEDCTILSSAVEVAKGKLHKAFVEWSEDRAQRGLTAKRFGALMTNRGMKERRSSSGRFWLGIGLK